MNCFWGIFLKDLQKVLSAIILINSWGFINSNCVSYTLLVCLLATCITSKEYLLANTRSIALISNQQSWIHWPHLM
jgi:hypothetical protein